MHLLVAFALDNGGAKGAFRVWTSECLALWPGRGYGVCGAAAITSILLGLTKRLLVCLCGLEVDLNRQLDYGRRNRKSGIPLSFHPFPLFHR